MIIRSIEAIPLGIPFKPGRRSAAGAWSDKNLRAFDSLLELFRPVVSTSIVLWALMFLLIAVCVALAATRSLRAREPHGTAVAGLVVNPGPILPLLPQ